MSHECGPKCGCGPECKNRAITDRKLNFKVEKHTVYGIDQYTFKQMTTRLDFEGCTDEKKAMFMEKYLLPAINANIPSALVGIRQKVHMKYALQKLQEVSTGIGTMVQI